MKFCSVDGCGKPMRGRGLCNAHLLKLQRYGSPEAGYVQDRSKPWALVRQAISFSGPDCLLWPHNRNYYGYGMIRTGRRKTRVHILVCQAAHGDAPSPQHQVAHNCNQPSCINPQHLRWATPKENKADNYLHGTINRGTKNGAVKLTVDQVRYIRSLPIGSRAVARELGISWQSFMRIRRRERWAWLV